jgi:hypothetical protein
MNNSSPSCHATKSEIVDLGHDEDIPTNAGSIHQADNNASSRSRSATGDGKNSSTTMEKDIEKGEDTRPTASTRQLEEEAASSNIVDFDGPDDMENPINWKTSKKWIEISLVSMITFLTPLASSMFAPAVPEVMREFNSTSDLLEGFMLSIYALGVSSCH